MSEETRIDEVISILSKLGVRVTPQRIIITKIILDNVKDHPSFKEIYTLVQRQLPRVGISTIFNTMKMLEKAGVIKIFEYNGETHIDRPEHHINIYCKDTNRIIDLENGQRELIQEIITKLSEKGYQVYNVNIIVEAKCNIHN